MDWSTIIVAIVSGISTGFLTALVTPWAQWAVDVRRDRRESRRKLISEWRDLLARQDIRSLERHPSYPSLLRWLTQSSRCELSRLVSEYDIQWGQFAQEELPRIQEDLKTQVLEAGYSREVIADVQQQNLDSAKERLGQPLRSFLIKQIAELEAKWKLL